jgi:hypothetical protein
MLLMGIAYADPASVSVKPRGDTELAVTVGKLTALVRIKTHEMQIGKPSEGRPEVIQSNCTYSKYPCSIVDRIDIFVNGTALFVPRSAFCDLADLNRAEIHIDEKGSKLMLAGGDGAEGFVVKIEFDATRVKRRTLAGGESGGQLSEDTTYHVVVFD